MGTSIRSPAEQRFLDSILSQLDPVDHHDYGDVTIPRRCSVAIVVRLHPHPHHDKSTEQRPEILFLKRASHPNDPWSGDVCFPGGHLEEGETHFMAAIRETLEETGINLKDSDKFTPLGQLSLYVVPGRKLCVRPIVFLQTARDSQPITLQLEEICAYRWVPARLFVDPSDSDALRMDRHELPISARFIPSPLARWYLSAIGLSPLRFLCKHLSASSTTSDANADDHADVPFVLWGLTLRMTDELVRVTSDRRLVTEPFLETRSSVLNQIANVMFGSLTEMPADQPVLDIRTYIKGLAGVAFASHALGLGIAALWLGSRYHRSKL